MLFVQYIYLSEPFPLDILLQRVFLSRVTTQLRTPSGEMYNKEAFEWHLLLLHYVWIVGNTAFRTVKKSAALKH